MDKNGAKTPPSPAAPANLLNEALALHRTGQLIQAQELYRKILNDDPQHIDALHLMGVLARQLNHPDVAINLIQRAIALNGSIPLFHNNLGTAFADQGEFGEALASYDQAIALDPGYADAFVNKGNALRAQGRFDDAAGQYEQAIKIDPTLAVAYNNLGNLRKAQEKFDEALTNYKRAIELRPGYVEAHVNMGAVLREQWKLEEAISCFRQAIALNPGFVEAYNGLGTVFTSQGKLSDAVAQFEHALTLNPAHVRARTNLAVALQAQGRMDESAAQAERALGLNADDPAAHYSYALNRLLAGDFETGWREYEWRRRQDAVEPHGFDKPLWDGKPLAGKTLVLHCEQGLGDSIQFIRYAGLIEKEGGRILLSCSPPPTELLRTAPGIDDIPDPGRELPPYDMQAALLTLPLLFGTRLHTIPAPVPYLQADSDLSVAWRERLRDFPGLKVGIVWRGNPKHKNDHNRSMKAEDFARFLDLEGVTVVNLQKDARKEELATLQSGGAFLDAAPDLQTFVDSAALISNLDLVISVDTAVCHLAGALNVPIWTLLPRAPDWRWLLQREDSPWYPSMHLFRQTTAGDWTPVIGRVQAALRALAKGEGMPSAAKDSERPGYEESSSPTEGQRRRGTIDAGLTDIDRWTNETQLERAWDARARRVADYIPAGAVVLDLGCGRMALEGFLPKECRYIPCDVARRDERTIVCDFNAGNYPDEATRDADIVTVLGVMEYLFDPKAFLSRLRQWRRPVVMSYCTTEGIGDRDHRRSLGWVNDFSYQGLADLLKEVGFSVQRAERIDGVQWLFRLLPAVTALPALKRVGVLSYFNVGNFGDRLGYHLINELLPAHAEVSHLTLNPLSQSTEAYDLLIVGIGNSLFGPMLNDSLLSLVGRSRKAIGIFGTQYHEATPRPILDALLDRLDHWYARYEDDVFRYGRGRENVSHLGDWLIRAFPMARPSDSARLDIGGEILEDLPLDRTIQNIQRHGTVFSTRIHPLLCALTSAEQAGYREQREMKGLVSGKFRSMLLDIFGRTFPEGELWPVDRDQVMAYKAATEIRVLAMRDHIHRLLND